MRLAMRSLAGVFLAFAAAGAAVPATSQEFPNKVVRIVIPSGPGNPQDVMARALGQEMTKLLGQPVVVENKPGAAQLIGYDYVAKKVPADGYTLVLGVVDVMVSLPLTMKEAQIDFEKDLAPITNVAAGRYVLAASAKQPWKSFRDLVADAKSHPGKFSYGYMAKSTSFMMEVLLRGSGLAVVEIPFGGNLPAYSQAMSEGSIQLAVLSQPTFNAWGDKVRALAITGEQRHPALRDVPTFAEVGFPQIAGINFSLFAPAGTPKAVIDRLNAAAAQSLQQPGMRATVEKMGLEIAKDTSPDAARKTLAALARLFSDVARVTGVKPQ